MTQQNFGRMEWATYGHGVAIKNIAPLILHPKKGADNSDGLEQENRRKKDSIFQEIEL